MEGDTRISFLKRFDLRFERTHKDNKSSTCLCCYLCTIPSEGRYQRERTHENSPKDNDIDDYCSHCIKKPNGSLGGLDMADIPNKL